MMLKFREILCVTFVLAYSTVALWVVSKDFSNNSDYYWEFVGHKVWQIILISVVCAAVALFSHHWIADVKKWTNIFALVLGLVPVYWSYNAASDAQVWMSKQMAVDAPSYLSGDPYETYWNTYRQQLGDVNAFGGIQAMYERFGSNLALNDVTIFLNKINDAPVQTVDKILDSAGANPYPVPVGLFISVFGYILLAIALSKGTPKELKTPIEA